MMAGKNQAALAVCAQTKVIFPFNSRKMLNYSLYSRLGNIKNVTFRSMGTLYGTIQWGIIKSK